MKQIGQHRNGDLRPHPHQGFELEGDEVAIEQHIAIGIQKPPERTGQRVRRQPVAHGGILHLGDEIGDGALFDRCFADEFQGAIERAGLLRQEFDVLERDPIFK